MNRVSIRNRSYYIEPVLLSGRNVRFLATGETGKILGIRFGSECNSRNAFIVQKPGIVVLCSRNDFQLIGG